MENNENQALQLWIAPEHARVNVTYAGQNGDLPDPVLFNAPDADVKGWIKEALRNGGIPGIPAIVEVDLGNFVLERFEPTEQRPYNLLQLRPKTPFGSYR